MLLYIARRLLQGAIVIVLISVGTFIMMRLLPGDPAYLLLGEGEIRISEEQIEAIRRRWGLDKPYHEQYLIWALNLLRGDFGDSLIRTGTPVRQMIFETIPVTAKLNVISLGAGASGRHPGRHHRRGAPQLRLRLQHCGWLDIGGGSAQFLAGVDADRAVRPLRAALVRRAACGWPHSAFWAEILAGLYPARPRADDRTDGSVDASHARFDARGTFPGLRAYRLR